jgi:hypothetical protein
MHADRPCIPTVLEAESSSSCVGGAPWHSAQPVGTVFDAELSLAHSHGGAVSCQSHPIRTMEEAHASACYLLGAAFHQIHQGTHRMRPPSSMFGSKLCG